METRLWNYEYPNSKEGGNIMIKVTTSSILKIGLVAFAFFITIPVEVLARPLRPDLEVVQPLYNDHSPLKMYLKWSHPSFLGIQEIQFRKKVEGGEYGPWCNCGDASINPPANHPCCERSPEYPLAFACVDKSALSSGVRYTYQVQVKINDVWSYPSNFRSNKADKVWPVTDGPVMNGECTGDESIGLMNGFNHVIQAVGLTHPYPHEGIDLRGKKAVPSASECVRAPVGGTIYPFHHRGNYSKGIILKYYLNGKKYYMGFNHLVYSDSLKQGTSVEPGQYLGKMATCVATSTGFQTLRPEQQHIHIDVEEKAPNLREGIRRNPLEIWNNPVYRDPQGSPPEVADTNSDNVVVRFRKGPDTATYLPDDGNVYGPVDIVVEAWDHQSVENRDKPEAKFHPPLKIGYYIQCDDGNIITDVVRSADTPYLLIDGRNWFGYPYWYGMKLPLNQIKKLADVDDSLRCSIEDRFGHREWFTYIVTNTKGIDGILDDLSASQCWVTDAKNTETSPNGYRGLYLPELPEPLYSTYETARLNQEAKFPDGRYQVRIRLEDYVHTVGNPEEQDYKHEVIVDNFLPFIERVTVTSGGETIYEAGWFFSAGDEQLNWVYYAEPKDPTPGEAVYFRIQTSETMQWLSVTLPGSQSPSYLVAAPDSQGMIWEATLYPQASDESTLTIQGQDMADNPLLAFSATQPAAFPDQVPKPVPKRSASGDWPADYDALRQDTSGDTLHQLGALPPAPVWTLTTPLASFCEEVNGGVVCSLKENSGASVGTGSVALGPQDFLESPPAEGPFVILNPGDRAGLTHTGLYGLPDEGLELTVQPRADWLQFCEGPTTEARCPESPKDAPGHKDPPELPSETKALTWQMTIDTNQETETCQIQVTWEHEDGQPVDSFTLTEQSLTELRNAGVPDEIVTLCTSLQDQVFPSQQTLLAAVEAQIGSDALTQYQDVIVAHTEQQAISTTLEIQPSTVCAGLPATASGTVDVTATCTWDVLETTTYEEYEQPETVVEPSEVVNLPLKYLCEDYLAWWPSFVYFYGLVCQENPAWGQPPEDQYFGPIIQPGEKDFYPTQLVAIRYSGCQWEEWPDIRTLWVNGHKRYGPVFLYDAETCRPACPECANTDACTRQLRGSNTCVVEREYLVWNGVWNCRFEQRPGTMTFTNPAQLLLDPEP
jgi:hypothetical protein